jgi:hypothetical protein
MTEKIHEIIEHMKSLGEMLMAYNFPRSEPEVEDEINVLKSREMNVDGYHVILHYSKSDYGSHYVETIQVLGKYCPFLPFNLVCKIAKAFLGEAELSLVELFKDGRKLYCWTVVLDQEGKAMPSPYKTEVRACSFEGFDYGYLNPEQVNFY